MSGFRPRQRSFGAKQPSRIEQEASVKVMIFGCVDVAALDRLDIAALAYRCGKDRREVECWIGAARRHFAEAGA